MRSFTVLVLLALSACTPNSNDSDPARRPPVNVSPRASSSPTLRPPPSCQPQNGGNVTSVKVTDVKYDAGTNSDTITFTFTPPAVPIWELKQATPPFTEDASGNPVSINGTHFFTLIFQGTDAHEFDGETARKSYPGPKELVLPGNPLLELEETGDFEATVSFVIGLDRLVCPAISEMQSPHRLILSFSHT